MNGVKCEQRLISLRPQVYWLKPNWWVLLHFWIAAKNEEVAYTPAKDLLEKAENKYNFQELKMMEVDILKKNKF